MMYEKFMRQLERITPESSVPEKAFFESERAYKRRLAQFYVDWDSEMSLLKKLSNRIKTAEEFYNEFFKPYEQYNDNIPIISIDCPDIEGYLNAFKFDVVKDLISESFNYFCDFPQGKIYKDMHNAFIQFKKKWNYKFLKSLIDDLKDSEKVIVITTPYKASYEQKQKFYSVVDSLKDVSSSQIGTVYADANLQWIAFDATKITDQKLRKLANNWTGEPSNCRIKIL